MLRLIEDLVSNGPEVRGEETVGVADSHEGGLDEVTEGTGGTTGSGVTILDTGKLKELLGDGSSDDSGTTGSGDKTGEDRTTLTGDLARDGVGLTEGGTPVTTTDRDDGELGNDDGTTDSGGNFLGALNTKTDVTVVVSDDNEGLETGTLTGTGLLLDGHDVHDLILEVGEEVVNDLVLLDGEGEEVDLLN